VFKGCVAQQSKVKTLTTRYEKRARDDPTAKRSLLAECTDPTLVSALLRSPAGCCAAAASPTLSCVRLRSQLALRSARLLTRYRPAQVTRGQWQLTYRSDSETSDGGDNKRRTITPF
jgi:hypothetical protein